MQAELAGDAAFFGIDPALLEAVPDASEGVWPEHQEALLGFIAVQTQWRVLPRFGAPPVWIGLDFPAVEAGLRLAGIEVSPERWLEIQVIETGAKAVLNGD